MTEPAGATQRPLRIAQAVFFALLALKLYATIVTPPIGDEAYYWMWSQKLGWSYFDHPPLHAWLLAIVSRIFGWNLFSLRILTWLTFAGSLWIIWLWSKHLKPSDPTAWFWPTAAIYLASPLFFVVSSVAFHDHLLVFLCFLSGHCFLLFTEKWEATGRGYAWLYAAAIALGLAVLTKYNGVLVGIGAAIFFIVRAPLRPLWRSPHFYLAALLSVAIQAPVLWWNATEGFASYNFHLSERWGGNLFKFTPINVLEFVGLMLVVVSPFLFPPIVAMIRRASGDPFADRARQLALSIFAVTMLVMGFLSFFIEVYFYWNVVGFALLMPLLAGWIRRRWVMYAHIGFGALVIVLYLGHTTILPGDDWTIASINGWPGVAERIEALEQQYPVGFVATSRYTTAAQLGFAMHDTEVTAIATRHDQYDYWFDAKAHEGQDALVVSDPKLGLAGVAPHFDSLTPLETVPAMLWGQQVYAPTIYLGRSFRAEPAQ